MSAVVQALILQLQVPRGLDELLDALPYLDLEILEGLVALDAEGRLRRIPLVELTTPFAPSEQLPVLRSLVSRLTRPGFAPPPRLFLATGAQRMSALARAVRSITDTVVPSEQPSNVALPQPLGILRLGDDIELSLVGLPADDQLAPCWALALPGAVAVVRLSDARHPALEAYCEALDVLLLDAESILGAIDIAVAGQLAALVRSSIELAAGV